jgi:peptidyl-prolyl cis-trans isomerase B (cyclophilin B)
VRSPRAGAVGALLVLALAGCVSKSNPAASDEPAGSSADAAPADECGFEKVDADQANFIGLPPEDEPVDATSLTFTTSSGDIPVQLDADASPCTVRSMVFLAEEGFYDGVSCHRITAVEVLKVLQCGDPNGDGTGGPGYAIPDELDSAEALPPAEDSTGEPIVTYTRGIVAMANAGPDTGGSQFFLVYGDSTLPPSYTVFGTVDAAGLAVLDKIAAGGIVPGPNGPEDGSPVTSVTIAKAEVS